MTCPNCNGDGCTTFGDVGTVPDWLANADITGDATKTWQSR